MKQQKQLQYKKLFLKARNACFASYLLLVLAFFGTIKLSAQNTTTFLPNSTTPTLIVYNGVSSAPFTTSTGVILPATQEVPSNQYKIEVRLGTSGGWTPVFAHKTFNKAIDGYPDDTYPPGQQNPDVSLSNYLKWTAQWSHTYGNIEMIEGTSVQVKITKLNPSTLVPISITSAAVRPIEKIVGSRILNTTGGFAIFTINKPGQITVDFNGAMDGQIKSTTNSSTVITGTPVHTVTLFANPIMAGKPAGGSTVFNLRPGRQMPDLTLPSNSSITTVNFLPGVHDLGINQKLYRNKQYYIPGDAIVYGTFNNKDIPILYDTMNNPIPSGQNIKVFGYGTISGAKQPHPRYFQTAVTDAGGFNDESLYKSILIENGSEATVEGISVVDPANHGISIDYDGKTFKNLGTASTSKRPITFAKWVKIITWRGNGDGIGSVQDLSNSFFRTNDDSGYIKGNKSNCIFWKDTNAAVFHMAGIPSKYETGSTTKFAYFPMTIKNCEVIYGRSREAGGGGSGIFHLRGKGSDAQSNQLYEIDLTVDNFKVSDPLSNIRVFNMFNKYIDGTTTEYGPMYSGMKFKNVNQVATSNYVSQNITIEGPANLSTSICFDNCKFNGVTPVLSNFIKTSNITLDFNCPIQSTARIGVKSKESVASSDITIYSNPDSKILHVNFPNADMSREIQVYNLLGQMVYKTTSQKTSTEIDARSLNLKGVAIVKVIAGDEVSSHKVLVQ